jgi:pilus assembly protein CpaC
MNRSTIAVLLGIAALCGAPGAVYAADAPGKDSGNLPVNGETITLAKGETKLISAKDVRNYSEGAPGIIDIKLTGDASQFVIAGKSPGSTTLLLIKADGTQITMNVDVFLRSPQVVEHELAQLLEGLGGVQVRRVGAHIVIDGAVANDQDLKRVAHVASLYPGQVDSLVQISSSGMAGPSGQEPQRFIIRIDFYFVQYDTDSTYAAGIGWPASIGGTAITSSFSYDFLEGVPHTATATLSNQPLPRLDIASTRGWAKVLKQATVITNNGVEAMFQNGGEQNFSITTGFGVGVQKIPFGTEVTVTPKFNPATRELDVKLQAKVADLTASVSGTPLPGRTTSELQTNVSLKLGQSLVLSGIRRESTNHAVTGLPLLKDIPVLGVLFGSHSDDTQATEGAVFIVPSVIEAIPTSAQELVNSAISKFKDYRGNMARVNPYDMRPGGTVNVPPSPKD